MKRRIHWLSIVAMGAAVLLSLPAMAAGTDNEDHERTRKEGKAMKISPNMYVEISNQYGNIEVETTPGDSLKIDVEITVRGDDQLELDEMMKMIDIEFRQTSGFVLVETRWADDVSLFRKSFHEISQTLGSKDVIEVNYKVRIPDKTNLEITNRFGDVFMGDYNGELELELAYGDFRAHRLTNVKTLSAKYGKLKVKEITGGARLDLNFMDSAELDETDDLFLKSASSEVEIGKVNVLQINSRHDEIRLEEVSEITGMVSLTDLEINEIHKKLDLTSKYGEIFIKQVGPDAQLINIEGSYSDYHLAFSPMFESAFSVEITDNREFTYDEAIKVQDQVKREDYITYTGQIGDNKERLVTIKSKSGYVRFGH